MYNDFSSRREQKIVHERLLGGFTLGDYRVDPGTGWLTGPGGRVHLSPRLLRTLLCLAAKAPAVTSHEELNRFVWGEHSGSHERLSHAIGELRRVLHDQAAEPRLIETMPMRGYRLMVAPVIAAPPEQPGNAGGETATANADLLSELRDRGVLETGITYLVAGWLLIQVAAVTFDQLGLAPTAATFVIYFVIVGFPIAVLLAWFIELTPRGPVLDRDGHLRARRPALSKKYVSVVTALALASLGVFIVNRYIGLPLEASALDAVAPDAVDSGPTDPNSIAVLPFANITGTEDGEILSLGLAEDIRNALNRVPRLGVASRIDSFSLSPDATSEEVRRRLKVAYYLEGTVQDFGSGGRVAVNLINSGTGRNRFTRELQYSGEDFSDFIALQDLIAEEAVAYLRVALPEETQTTDIPRETPGRDAYLSYRRGVVALYKPATANTISEAITHFENALAIYPNYAAAHAGICRAYAQGYAQINDTSFIERAESACGLALADSAELDVVHTALGDLYRSTGDLERAERAYEQALTINASSVDAAVGLARVFDGLGDEQAAEAQFLRAIELQPPGYWRAYNELGRYYFNRGQYDRAEEQIEKTVEIDPANIDGWNNLGNIRTLLGDFGLALEAFRNSLEIEPSAATYRSLGILNYYRGDFTLAEDQLRRAATLDPQDHVTQSNLGDVLTVAGDERGARLAFERARELAMRRLEVNERDYQISTDLAWIDAMLGDYQSADVLLEGALEEQPNDPYVHYIRALVATRRGERPTALDSLERARELGYPGSLLAAEPHLAPLRDDPRFVILIDR